MAVNEWENISNPQKNDHTISLVDVTVFAFFEPQEWNNLMAVLFLAENDAPFINFITNLSSNPSDAVRKIYVGYALNSQLIYW